GCVSCRPLCGLLCCFVLCRASPLPRSLLSRLSRHCLFFLRVSAAPHIYTLSLHDALPILPLPRPPIPCASPLPAAAGIPLVRSRDRKSTRLNSSHVSISYAVFCLKKKTQ